MQKSRHFLLRTFGKTWKWKFPVFVVLSLLIAFLPTFLLIDKVELNTQKFCEEWLKNILSLSAIFLIVNYLNFQIGINRSKDKISMLATNFCIAGDSLFQILETNFRKKTDLLNLVSSLEVLINKLQSEDEFIYNSNGLVNFSGYPSFFEKLRNHINGSDISQQQIQNLLTDYQKIKTYLNDYL
jgi:predicted signal transduction protein with EAL and GGDEF domain